MNGIIITAIIVAGLVVIYYINKKYDNKNGKN